MAVELTSLTSGSALGAALVNVLAFDQSLALLVTNWTQMETSLGAVSRVKSLAANLKPEDLPIDTPTPPSHWPSNGAINFIDVSAKYR